MTVPVALLVLVAVLAIRLAYQLLVGRRTWLGRSIVALVALPYGVASVPPTSLASVAALAIGVLAVGHLAASAMRTTRMARWQLLVRVPGRRELIEDACDSAAAPRSRSCQHRRGSVAAGSAHLRAA